MQLSVRDIAKMLKVPEREIFHWIEAEELPAYKIHDQYRFNRAELLEWISSRNIPVPSDLFPHGPAAAPLSLADALECGGIVYGLKGQDKESILAAMVQDIPLPPACDRNYLLQILLAREALASTGIGDGIAVPHVRNPVIFPVVRPLAMLFFLEKAVDFGALDGKPVRSLFTLVSHNVRAHLQLLSRLAFVLHDPDFKSLIQSQSDKETIFKSLRVLESRFKPC
jgi:PTS system nitrogen regulatory IIA component